MSVVCYEEDLKDLLTELQQYEFDFENIVFSGGGVKTTSYLGGIKVRVVMVLFYRCS